MDRNVAVAVASVVPVALQGTFERHCSPKVRSLAGSAGGGRWGPPGAYSVLYLGRPTDSVIVEAYRHLVDDVDGMTGAMVGPRRLYTCEVDVTKILDLREAEHRLAVSLSMDDLLSDTGVYAPCWRVARAAHQLKLHGIIAPAATVRGDTLALFEKNLPEAELPVISHEETWENLPADPRRLRLIESPGEVG